MPWTRKKKMAAYLAASLAVCASALGVVYYLVDDFFTGWHCPPTAVSSLADVPNVGKHLSAWQTTGPIYYRYRPVFGRGYIYVVAGVTSPGAISAFRATWPDKPLGSSPTTAPAEIVSCVKALSSVPGFAFTWSKNTVYLSWEGRTVHMEAAFDPGSQWFVAFVGTTEGL